MIAPPVLPPYSIDYAPSLSGDVKTWNFNIWIDYQVLMASRQFESIFPVVKQFSRTKGRAQH